jgi:hypothetical protein
MPKEHVSETIREVEGSQGISGDTTIATGETATISFGAISKIFSFLFHNDSSTSGYDVTLTLNTSITYKVKAGATISISDFEITSISITNASGFTVAYRFLAVGE